MEPDVIVEEHHVKKGRHRKKLLYSSILRQMEFYFSDSNLSKDRFLTKLIQDDPYIELSTILKFNKIRKLTSSIDDIVKALKSSELLEVSEDKTKIKRKTPVRVKTNTDDCTIYVEHIKSDTSHEWVSSVFSEFGKVQYVSIPKYKHNKLNKGFAFIEYEHPHEAQKALEYFDTIGLKMSSHMEPEKLCSIATFTEKEEEGKDDVDRVAVETENSEVTAMESDTSESKKRKNRESDEHEKKTKKKKLKGDAQENVEDAGEENKTVEEETGTEVGEQSVSEESEEKKRKKNKKAQKRKAYFKELGLQILSKDEWRKMRNKYLNNQRKKMQQLKQHLYKKRHQQSEEKMKTENAEDRPDNSAVACEPEEKDKLEYTPGVIAKIKLSEPCYDIKKTKSEIKAQSLNIQYIDIPLPSGSEEVFVRFTDGDSAKQFLNSKAFGEVNILDGAEEQAYWEKIRIDRKVKVNKDRKKLRGRDKLLKRAERELGKHIRFDENV